MKYSREASRLILARTPTILDAMLRDQTKTWTHANEGVETWSAYDVVGHLIHGERRDWLLRASTILEHGESQAFEPFDRFAQFEASKGQSMEDLLEAFHELRKKNLEALDAMVPSDKNLELKGTHPALGTVTLAELLSTWVVHDLGHIAQISRVMARQYENEVGPWKAYLPILNRR